MTEVRFKTTLHELDNSVVEKLKALFTSDAIVNISISNTEDETAYLLSTESNRASLYRSLEELKAGRLVQKTEEELSI